jgi:hypothetical protein
MQAQELNKADFKIENRKQTFMQSFNTDPLKKREEFAVSLRRKKKDTIIK